MDTWNDNPFPGLRPFQTDEAHLFFGRDGQAVELLRLLRERRFVAVVGPSGSGKSSLVRAGLLPCLHGGVMRSAGSNWRVAVLRPGANPTGNLARVLSDPDVLGERSLEERDRREFMEVTLRRGSLGLAEAVQEARLPAGENLLVVVDQFEEIFRLRRVSAGSDSRDDAAAFVKLLLEASRAEALPVYVLLTMRSDYLGDCAQFRDLPEAINRGQYLIPRMTRDERRAAITGPVAVGGGEIAPRLVSRILNDVGDEPDQLPILQHALMRAWDRWTGAREPGEPLDLGHYEAVGGAQDALSRHAEEAYADLDARGQDLAEKIFRRLTERGPDNRDIRRPTRFGELCAVVGAGAAEVAAIIEVFRRPGRSFLMPPPDVPLEGTTLVDISHESLIRGWGRLRDWVEEEAEAAKRYRRLADTAALWKAGRTGLLRDEIELADTLAWWERDRPQPAWGQPYHPGFEVAAEFLALSRKERDRERRRRRRARQMAVAALAGGLVITSTLAATAFRAAGHARAAADTATREKTAADSAKSAESRARANAQALERRANALYDSARSALNAQQIAVRAESIAAGEARQSQEDALQQLARATNADRRTLDEQLRRLGELRGVLSEARSDASLSSAPSLLSQEAWALSHLGLDSAAERSYSYALQFNPADPGVLVNRSDAYLNLGMPAEARADLVAALRLNPHNYLAHLNLAVADMMLHHYGDAARGFQNALDATRYSVDDADQSMVSPEIQKATAQRTLSLSRHEVPAALRYALASMRVFDASGSGALFDDLRKVDREEDWSINTALNALNWLWLSRKSGSWRQVSAYGQFAAEGALWERVGWSKDKLGRGVFADEAARSYCRFQVLHHTQWRSGAYANLARQVGSRLAALRPAGCSDLELDPGTPPEELADLMLSARRFAARGSIRVVDSLYATALGLASETQRPGLLLDRAEIQLSLGTSQVRLAEGALQRRDTAAVLARWSDAKQHFDNVTSAVNAALVRRPRYARAYLIRGQVNFELAKALGQLTRGDIVARIVADLDTALFYQPTLVEALQTRALALAASRPGDAAATLRRMLRIVHSRPDVWAGLAFIEMQRGEYGAAAAAADTAILLEPDNVLYYEVAEAANLGVPPSALNSPRVSSRLAPKLLQLGKASEVLREHVRAERFYLVALREYAEAAIGETDGRLDAQLLEAGTRYRCIFDKGARDDPRRSLFGMHATQEPESDVDWPVPAALERAKGVLRQIDQISASQRVCSGVPPS